MMRVRILRRVLLPDPLRPMMPNISPSETLKLTSWSAQIVSKSVEPSPCHSARNREPKEFEVAPVAMRNFFEIPSTVTISLISATNDIQSDAIDDDRLELLEDDDRDNEGEQDRRDVDRQEQRIRRRALR